MWTDTLQKADRVLRSAANEGQNCSSERCPLRQCRPAARACAGCSAGALSKFSSASIASAIGRVTSGEASVDSSSLWSSESWSDHPKNDLSSFSSADDSATKNPTTICANERLRPPSAMTVTCDDEKIETFWRFHHFLRKITQHRRVVLADRGPHGSHRNLGRIK